MELFVASDMDPVAWLLGNSTRRGKDDVGLPVLSMSEKEDRTWHGGGLVARFVSYGGAPRRNND